MHALTCKSINMHVCPHTHTHGQEVIDSQAKTAHASVSTHTHSYKLKIMGSLCSANVEVSAHYLPNFCTKSLPVSHEGYESQWDSGVSINTVT